MGRPPKEINWDVVESYMKAGTKNASALARKFNIQKQTFYRRFEEEYGTSFQNYHTDSQEAGLEDIRLMLYSKAMNHKAPGTPSVLMFMARCLLGMKEPETNRDVPPFQNQLDQEATIMKLQHRIVELEGLYSSLLDEYNMKENKRT